MMQVSMPHVNNDNNLIYEAPVCPGISVALADSSSNHAGYNSE